MTHWQLAEALRSFRACDTRVQHGATTVALAGPDENHGTDEQRRPARSKGSLH